MKKFFWMAALLLLGTLTTQAQGKYGHLNFGNIVSLMPDTEAADGSLKVYQDSLVTQGEKKAEAFQAKVKAYYEKVQSGELSPVQQQQEGQALEQEQMQLQQLESTIQQLMAARRDKLLAPIVGKVENAINTYAKENGYLMIFDTSVFNAILFAQDSDDLLEPIKEMLGL